MTTIGAACSSHDRYSISVVLPKLPVLECTESRPLRPTRLPEVPQNRKIQHCHHHHRTAQTTPQTTTNDAGCSSHGRCIQRRLRTTHNLEYISTNTSSSRESCTHHTR